MSRHFAKVMIFFSIGIVSIGPVERAFAGPEPKPKHDQGLNDVMKLISSSSNIEFQVEKGDKERQDHYVVFRYDKCLIKSSDEITIIDKEQQKETGKSYTENTVDLAEIGSMSVADADQTLINHKDYLRVELSCASHDKCIKDEKVAADGIRSNSMLDRFSFLIRKTAGEVEAAKLFNRALEICRHR